MDVGTDVANSVLSVTSKVTQDVSSEMIKSTTKNMSNLGYLILQAILGKIRQNNTNLEKILNSGQEVKMVEIQEQDLSRLRQEAKSKGITIAALKEKNSDTRTVVFSSGSTPIMEKVLDSLIAERLQQKNKNSTQDKPSVNEKITQIRESKDAAKEAKAEGIKMKKATKER